MHRNHYIARHSAETGLAVFPGHWQTKRPLVKFTQSHTRSVRLVDFYWSRHGENALPCVCLGASNLVVVDLDVNHGSGDDGIAGFEKLLDEYGELPSSPGVRTPRGGVHLYFRQPTGREPVGNSVGRIAPAVDVRGDGGYVIAPGAIMGDGSFYEAIAGMPDLFAAFAADAIPELPDWVTELASKPKVHERCPPVSSASARYNRRPYGLAVLNGEAAELAATSVGRRNAQLNKAAFVVASKAGAHGLIAVAETWHALWAACVENGYLSSTASGDGTKAFERTFYSGWNDGLSKPTPLRDRYPVDAEFAAAILNLKPRAA